MKHRIRFIPVFVVVAGVGLSLRVGDIATDVGDIITAANAQQQPTTSDDQTADAAGEAAQPDGVEPLAAGEDDAASPVTDPLLMTRSELDLLQDLAERRQQLDRRDQQQEMRERLLAATEARIDGKIAQLETIKTEIEGLLVAHQTLQNEQLQSLVKVYESMKPKDAARIMEKLEIEIQMEVATRMKESKMAPIMAAMAADAARRLTVELAVRARLPAIES